MALEYKLIATLRSPRPRSKRLRGLGLQAASSGGSTVIVNSSGSSGTSVIEGHTHANKAALDQISTDGDGYEYLTRLVQVIDEETGDSSLVEITEKVKAGYADEAVHAKEAEHAKFAHDLDEDSPVLKMFLSRLSDDVAEGRITFKKAVTILDNIQFGPDFITGIAGGKGGRIDSNADAELNSLILRSFLEVPELRFNRTSVINGVQWHAPGGGIVESVCHRPADGALNLLSDSNRTIRSDGYLIDSYAYSAGKRPAEGTECTLTVCYRLGEKDDFISAHQGMGSFTIVELRTKGVEVVESYKFTMHANTNSWDGGEVDEWSRDRIGFYHQPNDTDFDPDTYVKWAVVTVGDNPVEEWSPGDDDFGGGDGIVKLKLEPGELAALEAGDLCEGIWHMGGDPDHTGAENTSQPGAFRFTGFTTVYFRIESVNMATGMAVYKRRSGYMAHPQESMHFVAYGNNAYDELDAQGKPVWLHPERQTSAYSTRTYTRYLANVTDYDIGEENIMMQFGDLSGLRINGKDMSGYSAYLNNVYFTGTLQQLQDFASYEWTVNPAAVRCGADGLCLDQTLTVRCHRMTVDGRVALADGERMQYSAAWATGRNSWTDVPSDGTVRLWRDPMDGTFVSLDLRVVDADGNVRTEHTVAAVRDGSEGPQGPQGEPGESGVAGPVGPQGAVMRIRKFELGETYYAGDTLTDGVRWLDVVYTYDSYQNASYYECCKTQRYSLASQAPGTNATYWKPFSNLGNVLVDLLVANQAQIKFLNSQEITFGENGAVIGRIGAPTADGKYILWLGGSDTSAAVMTLDGSGRARFGQSDGSRVVVDPAAKSIDIYNADDKLAIRVIGSEVNVGELYPVSVNTIAAPDSAVTIAKTEDYALGRLVVAPGDKAAISASFDVNLSADDFYQQSTAMDYTSSVSVQLVAAYQNGAIVSPLSDVPQTSGSAGGETGEIVPPDNLWTEIEGNKVTLDSPHGNLYEPDDIVEDKGNFKHRTRKRSGSVTIGTDIDMSAASAEVEYRLFLRVTVTNSGNSTFRTAAEVTALNGSAYAKVGDRPLTAIGTNGMICANSSAEYLRVYKSSGQGGFVAGEMVAGDNRMMVNAAGVWLYHKGAYRKVNTTVMKELGIIS